MPEPVELTEGEAATVDFHGEAYRITDKIGSMPLMRFSKMAQRGEVKEQDAFAALYDLIEMCFDPRDWDRFQDAAMKHRSDSDELMDVVRQVFLVLADRPTSRPSDSSDGPLNTAPSSTSTPADRAIAQLAGRPDLQLLVTKAQEEMARAV